MIKRVLILNFCLIILLLPFFSAKAGFGVSPTFIKSEIVRPGTEYKQTISLLRSSSDEDLEARITIDAPEIKNWIKIDKGLSFKLPKGELRVPMVVSVNVPSGADLGNYSGQINVAIAPAKDWAVGIAVSLGALIDINLTVTDRIFSEFKIREVKIPDFEDPGQPWNNRFFSWILRRLLVVIRLENTGNIEIAPDKVVLDVYGVPAKMELDSLTSTRIEKIKPYETKELTISFPTNLAVGQYWGRVKIYKSNQILYNDQIAFTIAAPGTLAGNSSKSRNWIWLIFGAIGLTIVIVVFALNKFGFWRRILSGRNIVLLIIRFIKRRYVAIWLEIKFRFWRWVRYKSGSTISKNIGSKRKDQN